MNKLLNLLGLARRAGKLITGEELTVKAIQNNRAKLVFLASNASGNLKKKIMEKARTYNVHVIEIFSENELSQSIGTDRKVVAVTDDGFAKKMENLLMM